MLRRFDSGIALALAFMVTTACATSPEERARPRTDPESPGPTLEPPGCAEGQPLWHAEYRPAFHMPLAITFRGGPEAELRLTWVDDSLGLTQRILRVPEAEAAALEARLTKLRPWELRSLKYPYNDGITLQGTVCSPGHGETHIFARNPPTRGRDARYLRYFLFLLEAALPLVTDDIDQTPAVRLEHIQAYLSDELLVKDLGGSPRVVRLPVYLDFEPLQRFFAAIPETEDVIVDLRSVECTGTTLQPVFVALDTRKEARTLWVLPGADAAGVDYLSKLLGVQREHFVGSMAEARQRLAAEKR